MTKTTIASVVFAVVAIVALTAAAFVSGRNAGREQTQLDRLTEGMVDQGQRLLLVERRLEKIEDWKARWGKGAPGAEH